MSTAGASIFGFMVVRSAEHIWLLYAFTVLQLSFSALWIPAQSALLPEIVEADELVTANALLSGTWSTMLALGAALGGLATGLIGVYPAFAIDRWWQVGPYRCQACRSWGNGSTSSPVATRH